MSPFVKRRVPLFCGSLKRVAAFCGYTGEVVVGGVSVHLMRYGRQGYLADVRLSGNRFYGRNNVFRGEKTNS